MNRLVIVWLGSCLAACLSTAASTLAQAPSGPQTQAPPSPQSQAPAAAAGQSAQDEKSLPYDGHNGITISVEPCTNAAVAKDKFGKANPLPLGILPVEVFLHNETNQPVRINLNTVQLTVHTSEGTSQDIAWLSVREVASAIAHPHGPSEPRQPRFPIAPPTGADSKADKIVDILKPLALDADILPPQSVLHGFLFFDLDRDLSLAQNATLYVPDIFTVPANKPLMFFEVPLGPGAPAKP
jgi:hypothetical protein